MVMMQIDFGHSCVCVVALAALSLACLPLHCLGTVVYEARCLILMWSIFFFCSTQFPHFELIFQTSSEANFSTLLNIRQRKETGWRWERGGGVGVETDKLLIIDVHFVSRPSD